MMTFCIAFMSLIFLRNGLISYGIILKRIQQTEEGMLTVRLTRYGEEFTQGVYQ
jgi:hypothetical protein